PSAVSIGHVFAFRILTLVLFFFQAEDGIRDFHVTGVQTCALPISRHHVVVTVFGSGRAVHAALGDGEAEQVRDRARAVSFFEQRSEERRVGKECRARWSADDWKKNILTSRSNVTLALLLAERWLSL